MQDDRAGRSSLLRASSCGTSCSLLLLGSWARRVSCSGTAGPRPFGGLLPFFSLHRLCLLILFLNQPDQRVTAPCKLLQGNEACAPSADENLFQAVLVPLSFVACIEMCRVWTLSPLLYLTLHTGLSKHELRRRIMAKKTCIDAPKSHCCSLIVSQHTALPHDAQFTCETLTVSVLHRNQAQLICQSALQSKSCQLPQMKQYRGYRVSYTLAAQASLAIDGCGD